MSIVKRLPGFAVKNILIFSRNVKKLGAISLAFYAFFTLIVAGVIVYYFVYDGGVNSEVVFYFILPILFITLLNLLMAFRAIKILAKTLLARSMMWLMRSGKEIGGCRQKPNAMS